MLKETINNIFSSLNIGWTKSVLVGGGAQSLREEIRNQERRECVTIVTPSHNAIPTFISEEVNGNSDSIIVNADTETRKTMFEPAIGNVSFCAGGGSKTLLNLSKGGKPQHKWLNVILGGLHHRVLGCEHKRMSLSLSHKITFTSFRKGGYGLNSLTSFYNGGMIYEN